MADTKLSALVELAATPAVDDEVYIRDVSELAADESKRITTANLLASAIANALLTTRGDIIYRNATVPARLAKGTSGQVLTMGANDPAWAAAAGGATIVRKTADETVNNSSDLQNDDHLLLAIGANEIWLVELFLLQGSVGTASDFKFAWAYPDGCGLRWGTDLYWASAATGATPSAISTESFGALGRGTGNLTQGIHVTIIVFTGATAGNLQLQWAQNTATAEDTKVLTNSCLIAHKLA